VLAAVLFQEEDGIRGRDVTGVQTCALPILTATVVCSVVTVHGPLRSHPPRTANDVDGPGPPVTLRAGPDSCCGSGLRSNGWRAGERSRVSSARSDWNTAA